MKIRIMSDLHLEFGPLYIHNMAKDDVLILSGDIVVAAKWEKRYDDFFKKCSELFEEVFYVLGNHEHYNGTFQYTADLIRSYINKYPNIHLLDRKAIDHNGITFVGVTLWTDCNKEDPLTFMHLNRAMNDFAIVDYDDVIDGTRTMRAQDTVEQYKKDVEFINTFQTNEYPIVVIGHHAPTAESIHPRYRRMDEFYMNGGYHSDLSEVILNNPKIKLWTHGHMHDTVDYMVGDTRVVCNPRGYMGYDFGYHGFNVNFSVEI